MPAIRILVAAVAALGVAAWSSPARAETPATPTAPCVAQEPVGQDDDFAFPGRDYNPSLFPADATQDCSEEWEKVAYDDFAFPGRDLLPLFWPPTALVADDAFPGKDAPPRE